MPEARKFRVGLTPDWGERLDDILRPGLVEVFDPIPDLEYEVFEPSGDMVSRREVIDRYDAVLALAYYFPREALDGVKRLKCIARWGVGYDRIDVAACTANDVFIGVTPTMIRRTVSEGALALIFALAKNLRRLDIRTRSGIWRENFRVQSVNIGGRTLGSLGLGNIAGELFRMAKGVGFGRLLAHDPYCPPGRAEELGVELVDFDTLLRESDFVCLNAPLTEETRGMIDARALALMKPSAYLINTARGELVDEEALERALAENKIAGAAIDVFTQEPPPKEHPFFALENTIVTPHTVALTEEGVKYNTLECLENIKRIYEGRAPLNFVNREVAGKPSMLAKLAAWRKS